MPKTKLPFQFSLKKINQKNQSPNKNNANDRVEINKDQPHASEMLTRVRDDEVLKLQDKIQQIKPYRQLDLKFLQGKDFLPKNKIQLQNADYYHKSQFIYL